MVEHSLLRINLHYGIAFGAAEAALDIPIDAVALAYLNQSIAGLVSGCQRVSLPPRCRLESLPSGTPFAEIDESPTLAIAILRDLAESDSGLSQLPNNRPLRTESTPACSS